VSRVASPRFYLPGRKSHALAWLRRTESFSAIGSINKFCRLPRYETNGPDECLTADFELLEEPKVWDTDVIALSKLSEGF
jgi:hypothetical protein